MTCVGNGKIKKFKDFPCSNKEEEFLYFLQKILLQEFPISKKNSFKVW